MFLCEKVTAGAKKKKNGYSSLKQSTLANIDEKKIKLIFLQDRIISDVVKNIKKDIIIHENQIL